VNSSTTNFRLPLALNVVITYFISSSRLLTHEEQVEEAIRVCWESVWSGIFNFTFTFALTSRTGRAVALAMRYYGS
jgi:hypothetical protein